MTGKDINRDGMKNCRVLIGWIKSGRNFSGLEKNLARFLSDWKKILPDFCQVGKKSGKNFVELEKNLARIFSMNIFIRNFER
ncbi:MAG: hypothetical protein LBR08_11520 [Bacteroidales bacterium]|jgi:hypothetical protein|nr:hypothetical protein [Bacteroidales bacterium]